MLEKLFYENLLINTVIGLFVAGMLLKVVLGIGYSRMIRASNNMGCTKYKLLRNLKLKFETLYKLKINVNNVDIFVDKCINNHKILGILLITWERASGQVSFISCIIGFLGAILGLILEIDRMWILSVFSVGFLSSGLLIFFEALLNKKAKKEIIRLNILDYLENYLNNRLEQEDTRPELIQEYKKYFSGQNARKEQNLVAAADEFIQVELGQGFEPYNRKPSYKERRLRVIEDRKARRKEKEARKLFKKQAKKASKIASRMQRKEDKQRCRLEAKNKRQEKAKEKQREIEIKKALKLEKKLSSRYKEANRITPAQQNKESLKKEIKELRKSESRNQNGKAYRVEELEYEYETVRNITGTTQSIHTIDLSEKKRDSHVNKNMDNVDKRVKTSNIRGITDRRVKNNIRKVKEGNETRSIVNINKLERAKRLTDTKDDSRMDEVAATKEDFILKGNKVEKLGNGLLEDQDNIIKNKSNLSKEDKQIIEDILKEYLA